MKIILSSNFFELIAFMPMELCLLVISPSFLAVEFQPCQTAADSSSDHKLKGPTSPPYASSLIHG
jgi:hypothetical protein